MPGMHDLWARLDQQVLTIANFLMAMAMAGLGLQVDVASLRTQGLAAVKVAVVGWFALFLVAIIVMHFLQL